MSAATSATTATAAWKTIFLAEIDATLTFSMVEYADGQLDVLRNGTSISPTPWPSGELVNCVRTFQKVSRLAAAAAQANPSHPAL